MCESGSDHPGEQDGEVAVDVQGDLPDATGGCPAALVLQIGGCAAVGGVGDLLRLHQPLGLRARWLKFRFGSGFGAVFDVEDVEHHAPADPLGPRSWSQHPGGIGRRLDGAPGEDEWGARMECVGVSQESA